MNTIAAIGNLTRDPEKMASKTDKDICKFTIAVERTYKDANGQKIVDFLPIVALGKLAELCTRYLEKGKKVAITGVLQSSSYTDKDGNKRTGYSILADKVDFLSPASGGTREEESNNMDDLGAFSDNGLPF